MSIHGAAQVENRVFFAKILLGKEAQRQNVKFCLEGQKKNYFVHKTVAEGIEFRT